jgi:hypothetical protein
VTPHSEPEDFPMIRTALCSALLAAAATSAPARAETTQCMEIASLPATLTTQGVYCLKKDLATAMTSGAAITFASNNITLDCNDRKLGGLQAGPATTAVGLLGTDRMNLTVRGCNIRGFQAGIAFTGVGGGHLVEGNRFDGNTAYGINLEGDGSRIRDNGIFDTGASPDVLYVAAIRASGDVEITGNTIRGVTSPDAAIAIYVQYADHGLIADNRIGGAVGGEWGAAGINAFTSPHLLIRGNYIAGPGWNGVNCSAGGHAIGNQVVGFENLPLAGCYVGPGNYTP